MKKLVSFLVVMVITVTLFAQTTYYVNDNSNTGDVFTAAIGNNGNAGTAVAPFAALQYAINQASAGDIIYVDAGTYTGQVTIDKGITIIGAGQTLTLITNSSQLVAPPGPFTEYGLIQTTQGIGDVHIRDITATNGTAGDGHTIMIQSGGSVKNCKLINGGQSVFFRIPDATVKTALIENCQLEPTGIGINCQGSGLTATIKSNTISKASSFYSGIFAGLDFGPLPQLTIQNNIINNYFGDGMLVASFNGTYTSNSITGTGTFAINRNGNGGNTPIATCNWFGSSNAGTVASKISGTVLYSPFLTSGTDNSSNAGFQPAAACGTGNTYYVNDNSTVGDVFTNAAGNDANAGTAATPFATIQYAVNIAAANDIIYVDAGSYTEQVTITKGITIIGAGKNATSILIPATTVAPPGPFTEQGVIQTAQNIGDVNIKDLSVTGALTPLTVTPIIIQSGGSVRNCKLQSGNQGLFVRVDPATNPSAKTFVVEGNIMDAEYIAVNFEGANITATLSNNTLTANNTGFSAGMFANLNQITATNNLFSKYFSYGILINVSNASITQNAFTGAGSQAINRTGGANVTANCNWYGVANASSILPKITPGVIYYPWYIDGTDASPEAGFQHWTESCGASSNIYYVNDNSTAGDIFTTTIGNDANAGTSPTSPLATFGAALTKASPGASIYFDAGTYTAQNVTIGKTVNVIGTNYHVSPNSSSNPLLLNSTRNAESIIDNSNWVIGADGINFTGLTFNPLSNNAIVVNSTSFGNFNLSRNRVRINSLFPPFVFNGAGTAAIGLSGITNWGLTISENRFEKEDASSGNTIRVNRFGSVNIYNNSFVVTGTTERTQNFIAAGNAGVVNYLNINNNTFDKAATAINTNTLGYTFIYNNKFSNSTFAFNGNNLFPESSDITFSNNTMDGSGGVFPFVQYTRQAGDAAGASSSFKAENNTISGTAVAGTTTLLGSMNLIFANSVLNQSLAVRNNKITYSGNLSTVEGQFIRPIMMRGNLRNAVVEKNEITLNGSNLQPANPTVSLPVCPAITLYTENGAAAFLQPGSVVSILNNKVHGFKHSVAVYDPGTGSGAHDAYIGFGNIPFGATVNINNNSFTGDSISINNGTNSETVNATCNWYGSAAAQNIINKLSISTIQGVPYLTNGTDNDAATGFQPAPGACDGYPTLVTLNGSTNITCNGANNGTINITSSYGKAPFVYTWTKDGDANFVSHDEDPTGLTPGTYHLSLVDGNGSNIYFTAIDADGPGTISVTLSEPPVLTASASGTNNLCYGQANGTAAVTAGGGTSPYTYLWSNGATTQSISNLTAGVYSVTVTDANGCTANASYEVTEPSQLTATASGTNVSCFGGNNGTASVSANGGTGAYTYLWSNDATTQSISNLTAGVYSVTVTDANGCTANASYEVTEPTQLTAAASGTNVSCFGGNNGTAAVSVNGGTAAYSYLWSNGATTQSIINLTAGVYSVTVTDANGCTVNSSYEVTEPGAIIVGPITGSNLVAVGSTIQLSNNTAGGTWSSSNNARATVNTNGMVTGVAAGTIIISYTITNSCINTTKTFSVTVVSACTLPPATPGGITGTSNLCPVLGVDTLIRYSIAAVSTATSYNWILPAGATIDSGGSGTKILVNYKNVLPSSFTEDTIRVSAINNCGSSAERKLAVSKVLPVMPGVIAGNTDVCSDIAADIDVVYSISPVASAATYNWEVPANAVLQSGQGTTSILIRFSSSYTTGTVKVQAVANCGSSSFRTLTVTKKLPATPGVVSASNDVCSAIFTSTTITYSIAPVALADSYLWTLPDGMNLVSGQGTTSLTVSFNPAYSTGILSVVAVRSCGTSAARTLTVRKLPPARPGTISIVSGTICNNGVITDSSTVTFSILPVTNAATYTWGVPTGSKIYSGQGSTTVVVKFRGTFTTGAVSVKAVSVCGTGLASTLSVTSTSCTPLAVNNKTNVNVMKECIVIPGLKTIVFPNPHHGSFGIRIDAVQSGTATVEIMNLTGQHIASKKVAVTKGNNNVVQFANMRSSVLLYKVTMGKEVKTGKIIGAD